MGKIKIIANYLPQFHVTKENSKWWGEGYTDWEAVKKASPVYKGQIQPRKPYNENYYDLSQKESLEWQADLAKEYGIYGFGIYHYWFDSDTNLLSKPAEILLDNKDIDINFLFIWDNATWKRTWSNVEGYANDWVHSNENGDGTNGVLAELNYGCEVDWKEHFNYLLPFFKDDRYIKKENKPIFAFFNQYNDTEKIQAMVSYWNKLAIQAGFEGVYIIGRYDGSDKSTLDYEYTYEPSYSAFLNKTIIGRIKNKIKTKILKLEGIEYYQYDKVWENIIEFAKKSASKKIYYGGLCAYDDTPRRGGNAKIILKSTPEKFRNYLKSLTEISLSQGKEYIFLTAWNEWGEGAYLEPDVEDGFKYLEAVREVLKESEDLLSRE